MLNARHEEMIADVKKMVEREQNDWAYNTKWYKPFLEEDKDK